MFLKISQNLQENIFTWVYYIKKEIPTQVFSYEFCKFFKKTFFTEHLRETDSVKIIPSHDN